MTNAPGTSAGDGAPRGLFSPKGELWAAITMGACLLVGTLTHWLADTGSTLHAAGEATMWAALAIGLFYGGRAALESVAVEKRFDIDVLMFLGAVLAAYLGAPAEGALLLFLFTLSGALEELAMARTRRAVEALHGLMPTAAQKWDGAGWTSVAPESLATGDRVRILPGENIPADARIAKGATSVNQATLTGESMPRDVMEGDEVYAGTINVGDPVEAVVVRAAAQSSLQKILNLVLLAQQQREPVQRLIDRISQPYAIGVTLASLAVWLIWWQALGFEFKDAVYTAITLLIVASPCALIISTPTATLAGISRGARGGVLFKGGQSIERLARVRAIAFDKTGTLTIGRPRVLQVYPLAWSDESRLLAVAAALEGHSTHPIAEAVVQHAASRSITPSQADEVRYVQGRGVIAMVDGVEARLGSLAHVEDLVPVCLRKRLSEALASVQGRGHIAVVCAHGEQAAVIVLSDATRPGADCLVERLHAQRVRPVVMLTGDNKATAAAVAEELRLDEFHAQLLPADKVAHVERLKREHHVVGVIGDGVNDAPALARADVAIGIGSIGSDAALESADIVLLSDDLSAVPWSIHLARRVRRTVKINLSVALGAIAIMVVATIVGSLTGHALPLWMGVIGHEGGTLLVVGHSLLLLTFRGVPLCTCEAGARRGSARPVDSRPISDPPLSPAPA